MLESQFRTDSVVGTDGPTPITIWLLKSILDSLCRTLNFIIKKKKFDQDNSFFVPA